MNITMDLTRTILTVLLTILSMLTSLVGMKYKGDKKELLNFVYDSLMMLVSGVFIFGTFAVIYQLLLVKVKSYYSFYELAKLSDEGLRAYKKPLITLIWLSVLGEFVAFVLELFRLFL